jgi:hypothetical protein
MLCWNGKNETLRLLEMSMLHIYKPRLGGHWDVEDANISDGDALVDEVEINLNILGALMLGGVGGEPDGISTPPPHRWQLCGTPPQHSNMR